MLACLNNIKNRAIVKASEGLFFRHSYTISLGDCTGEMFSYLFFLVFEFNPYKSKSYYGFFYSCFFSMNA